MTGTEAPMRRQPEVEAPKGRSGPDWALVGRYAAMIFLGFLFLFPVVYMFVSSLKPDAQIVQDTSSMRAFLPVGDISLRSATRASGAPVVESLTSRIRVITPVRRTKLPPRPGGEGSTSRTRSTILPRTERAWGPGSETIHCRSTSGVSA